MASAVSAITGSPAASSAASSSSSSAASSASSLSAPSEEMFLQLLVSQLQNQDPLNPTDSTQFVSQLAQFSELEQTIGIRSDIESYMAQNPAGAATTGTDASTTNSATSTSSS